MPIVVTDTTGMDVQNSQINMIGKLLDATAARQRVISQNVANVNTPGYLRQEVSFESELAKLLDGGKPGDLPSPSQLDSLAVRVYQTPGLAQRADGNNVDIDVEMGQMTKNSMLYETYAQVLSAQLGMMRSAINGQA